jgi:hypothetical protein
LDGLAAAADMVLLLLAAADDMVLLLTLLLHQAAQALADRLVEPVDSVAAVADAATLPAALHASSAALCAAPAADRCSKSMQQPHELPPAAALAGASHLYGEQAATQRPIPVLQQALPCCV